MICGLYGGRGIINRKVLCAATLAIALVCANAAYSLDLGKVLSTPELKQAWMYLEMDDFTHAESMLNGCYMNTTDAGAACNYIRARILDKQKNILGAIDAYRRVYTRTTNADLKQETLFRKSELFFEKKYYYEASSGFRQYAKLFPDGKNSEKAQMYLARCYDLTNKQADALDAYEKAGDSSTAIYGKANMLQRLGKTKEAQQVYAKAVEMDSEYMEKNDESRYYYAENLYQTGNIAKAREMFQQIIDVKYRDKISLALGTIAANSSNEKEAITYLIEASESKSTDIKAKALVQLAHIYAVAGKAPLAKQSLDALKRLSLDSKGKEERDMLFLDLYITEKNYKDAVKILNAMIVRNPNSKELVQRLETLMNDTAQFDKDQFIVLWTAYGVVFMDIAHEQLILRAAELLREGGGKPYTDILVWISQNLLDEQRQKALYELSQYYADMGEKTEAVKYLGQLKKYKIPPDDILRSEARVLYANNDLQGTYERLAALRHLKREDLPMLRDAVGAVKDKERALAFYEQVLKGMGGETGDALTMADNLYLIGRKDEAINYYKQVLAQDPSNEWALYRTGMLDNDTRSQESLKKLSEGNSQLSKFARSVLQGNSIDKKLEELK
ncbi:MAG: tetratricopeptide repeat protein [Candidatus Magnetominusculus sp. LBB02]|nr:tetratricopeptide repeat protein [Candidatus Magnetominusculus sp. LBB02]